MIREAAESTPVGTWIHAFGFDHAKYDRAPTRWDLDQATTRHPVLVYHVSGHHVLVNSAAMQARGLDETTPDPPGGELVRDGDGRLTGLCLDAAMNLILPVVVDIGSHGPNFHTEAPLAELVDAVARAGAAFLAVGPDHRLRRPGQPTGAGRLPGGPALPGGSRCERCACHCRISSTNTSRSGSPAPLATIDCASGR